MLSWKFAYFDSPKTIEFIYVFNRPVLEMQVKTCDFILIGLVQTACEEKTVQYVNKMYFKTHLQ